MFLRCLPLHALLVGMEPAHVSGRDLIAWDRPVPVQVPDSRDDFLRILQC